MKELSLRLETAQTVKEHATKVLFSSLDSYFPQIKKDMDALKVKVEQANEEIKHLKDMGLYFMKC